MATTAEAWAQQQIAARAEQGLEPTVTDPIVLARVAALLQQGEVN